MFLDHLNMFSEGQAVTASAASDNTINIENTDLGSGEPVGIYAAVVEGFAGCTSVKLSFEQSDTDDFASKEVLFSTAEIPVAKLTAGYRFRLGSIPPTDGKFLHAYYTVAGPNATAGKITCALCLDKESGR